MKRRRVGSTVGLVALAAVAASGCTFMAPQVQSHERSQVQGLDVNVGTVGVRDAFLTQPSSTGSASLGATPAPATPSYLTMTMVNLGTSTDTLTSITGPDGTVSVLGGPITLRPGVLVKFGNPSAGTPGPVATYTPRGTMPGLGRSVPLTFSFTTAGSSRLYVPITNDDFSYAATTPLPTTQATMPSQGDLPSVN